jgi:putative exporter of polyketide antibiotics
MTLRLYRVLLSRERGFLLGWTVGLLAYFLVIGASYASIKDHAKGVDALWKDLPQSFKEAFGDVQSVTTPGGYFEARGTALLPLVLGGALAAQATRRLSGAEQSGELDLVLSLPVRRTSYFWSHWGVGATLAAAWLAACTVGGVLGMAIAGVPDGTLPRIAFMVAEALPFLLGVHAVALLAGAGLHRRPPGTAILAAMLAGFFLVQIVGNLDAPLHWLRAFSPYALLVEGDAFRFRSNPGYLAESVLMLVAGVAFAARAWRRKDLLA